MGFADYSGAFGSSGPSFNPSSFGGGYNLSSSTGSSIGGGGMGPELAFAGISSAIGGIASAYGANQQAKGMIQAANIQAQAQRDAAFQNLLAGQYALTGAKEFDRFQQQHATDYSQAFLDPRKSEFGSEATQRTIADTLSPNAQKVRWQQNTDQLNRTLSEKRAVTDAMFGPIAERPFAYGNMPGYATSSFS